MSAHPTTLEQLSVDSRNAVARRNFILRARTFIRRSQLVGELASGARPDATPERALCAARLTEMHTRRGVAASVVNVMDSAMEPPRGISAAVPLARRDIIAARPALLGLNRRLCAPGPINPRGVALVEQLLRDGSSPLYIPSRPGALDASIRQAMLAMDAGLSPAWTR